MMGKQIIEYLEAGWNIHLTENTECFNYYLSSPSGSIFYDRHLRQSICSFCEDAEFEGCISVHSDKLLFEEKEAKRLNDLLNQVPFPRSTRIKNLVADYESRRDL